MTNTIDLAVYITWAVGTLLPAIVGQVTKAHWPSWLKGLVLLALSALASALGQWIDSLNSHTPFTWRMFALGFFGAFVAAQAAHTAILKHTPLTNTVTSIAPMDPLPPYPPAGAPPIESVDINATAPINGSTAQLTPPPQAPAGTAAPAG